MSTRSEWVEDVYEIDYYLGSDAVACRVLVPHGAGKREVRVLVDPKLIVELGRALEGCTTAGERGHAIWHLHHPGSQKPCESCKRCPHPPKNRSRDGNYCSACQYEVDR